MVLRKLTTSDCDSFLDYAQDFEPDNRNRKIVDRMGFDEFLHSLEDLECGRNLRPGYVKSRSYFLFDGERIMGRLTFREQLNERTIVEGGNIGYEIRPSMRNRGLATSMLSDFLKGSAVGQLKKVLITCDVDNYASEKVILKNGGALESIESSPRTGKLAKRYWIEISGGDRQRNG